MEEKLEVSGTKKYLLFFMSQLESMENFQKHLNKQLSYIGSEFKRVVWNLKVGFIGLANKFRSGFSITSYRRT